MATDRDRYPFLPKPTYARQFAYEHYVNGLANCGQLAALNHATSRHPIARRPTIDMYISGQMQMAPRLLRAYISDPRSETSRTYIGTVEGGDYY